MKLECTIIAVATLFAGSVARAEPPQPAPLEYGFDDELVAGDMIRPHTEVVEVRRRNVRASLVEVRATYLPELLKSVEDL